jgi:entericidin B
MCASAQNIEGERRINIGRKRADIGGRFYLSFYYWRSKMIRNIMASLLATVFIAGLFGTLAGCNTIEGAGQDIQQGGKAIKDEAKEIKNKM